MIFIYSLSGLWWNDNPRAKHTERIEEKKNTGKEALAIGANRAEAIYGRDLGPGVPFSSRPGRGTRGHGMGACTIRVSVGINCVVDLQRAQR